MPSRVQATKHAPESYARVLSRRLIRFRELRGLSQTQLAAAAGVSRSALNALESGQSPGMMVATLCRLSFALDVTPDALLGYDETPLVRSTVVPQALAGSVRAFVAPRVCPQCGKTIPGRGLHPMADCLIGMYEGGDPAVRIGAVFGLSTDAVEAVLAVEYAVRRRRLV